MKRKSLTMILCLLTCLSLVGVGFAAWVITGPAEEDVTGNIIVDSVTDNRYTLTVVADQEDIRLTGPAGATTGWLTSNATETADLEVVVTCTLTKKSGETFNSVADVTLDADFTEPTDEKYVAAKTAKCFEYENSVISDQELSTDKLTLTFKVTITYKWGEIFNYSNPYTFYNDGKKSNDKCGVLVPTIDSYAQVAAEDATWSDHANYYLRVLGAIQNTVSYSLTVSATPATA